MNVVFVELIFDHVSYAKSSNDGLDNLCNRGQSNRRNIAIRATSNPHGSIWSQTGAVCKSSWCACFSLVPPCIYHGVWIPCPALRLWLSVKWPDSPANLECEANLLISSNVESHYCMSPPHRSIVNVLGTLKATRPGDGGDSSPVEALVQK